MLSVFIREPEFEGQTKDRLATPEAARLVETAVRDPFDHWLAAAPNEATRLLDWVIERPRSGCGAAQEKEIGRKTAARKLRLPGKLADCTQSRRTAPSSSSSRATRPAARPSRRATATTQAVLPLRGKILNVASAGREKLAQNQQLADLIQALGVGTGARYRDDDLRYEQIIIMTDADVDGAHIASLLMTFFYREMPELIDDGHLFLAVPPLYRLTQGAKTVYARDDAMRGAAQARVQGQGKVEVSRFKGLGEMMPAQLKETTMDPAKRTLLRVEIVEDETTGDAVERLMGNKPEARFRFIQERAEFAAGSRHLTQGVRRGVPQADAVNLGRNFSISSPATGDASGGCRCDGSFFGFAVALALVGPARADPLLDGIGKASWRDRTCGSAAPGRRTARAAPTAF